MIKTCRFNKCGDIVTCVTCHKEWDTTLVEPQCNNYDERGETILLWVCAFASLIVLAVLLK